MTPQLKTVVDTVRSPWHALWAMMIGFFMILVDSTIVAVANPSIMEQLQTDYDGVIWVTSAYLLAYAVPLLVTGRLGDQFGPKNLYLAGLAVFTAASLWCGLSGSIEMLIAARVVQGIGAALLTPQTLTTITRIFPSDHRGTAMGVWGATAGLATLAGPLVGGVLLDHLGWEWIFFVNVPIGIAGLALAVWLVPALPTHRTRFDWVGVALSGAGMFLVVFGLQEGESHGWSGWVWATIVAGIGLLALFVYWQAVNKDDPLIPLQIFRDRDFSMSSVGIAIIGFAVTAMVVPVMFYLQVVCGLSPTRAALLMAPTAVVSGLLAPVVGRVVDRAHPTPIIGFGFSALAISLTWLSVEMTPTTANWRLVLPFIAMGIGMACIWSPLAATATRNLPPELAGAGSGVYNTTRQVGSVLGSAGIAAFMTSRIGAEMPQGAGAPPTGEGAVLSLPEFLHAPFSAALSQSMLLPALIALFGVVAAMFLLGGLRSVAEPSQRRDGFDDRTEVLPAVVDEAAAPARSVREYQDAADRYDGGDRIADEYTPYGRRDDGADDYGYDYDDAYDDDDDDYVEFTVASRFETSSAPTVFERPAGDEDDAVGDDDFDTEPLSARVPSSAPGLFEVSHSATARSGQSLAAPEGADAGAESGNPADVQPIGFAHNGFHADREDRFQPLPPVRTTRREADEPHAPTFQQLAEHIDSLTNSVADLYEGRPSSWSAFEVPEDRPPRHRQHQDSVFDAFGDIGERDHIGEHPGRRPRHYREDPDDGESYGRHYRP